MQTISNISRGEQCDRFHIEAHLSPTIQLDGIGGDSSKVTLKSDFKQNRIHIPLSEAKQTYLRQTLIENERCRRAQNAIDLLASVLTTYSPEKDNFGLAMDTVKTTPLVEKSIFRYVELIV